MKLSIFKGPRRDWNLQKDERKKKIHNFRTKLSVHRKWIMHDEDKMKNDKENIHNKYKYCVIQFIVRLEKENMNFDNLLVLIHNAMC